MIRAATVMKTTVSTPVNKIPLPPFAKGGKTQRFPLYQRGIEGDFHGNQHVVVECETEHA